MRKLAIILLALAAGWFCGTDAKAYPSPAVPECGVQTSIDVPAPDELRCEREYNSDLGLPRTTTVEPVRTFSVRTVSCPGRLGVKCGVSCDRTGVSVGSLPEFTRNLLIAGGGAVDYYVYRLRRLLI